MMTFFGPTSTGALQGPVGAGAQTMYDGSVSSMPPPSAPQVLGGVEPSVQPAHSGRLHGISALT